MKSDIDRFMQESDIDALLIVGSARHNAAMTYFTGIVHVSNSYVLKKRNRAPILFHSAMERDEAARTNMQTKNLDDYDSQKLLQQAEGNSVLADALRFKQIFDEFKVEGRISIHGVGDVGAFYGLFQTTKDLIPEVEFVVESRTSSVLTRARITKDEAEVARIRKMGEVTTDVVAETAQFLSSHKAKNGHLTNSNGETLTIGEVKRQINIWLAQRGAENSEGTIFAIGADAGVPHSSGVDDQPVELGKPIVFDIFPRENGGGYFFDFTRTWCLGHAPDNVLQVYQDVFDVYHEVYQALEPGKPCTDFQQLTCELFESRNHPTVLNSPDTEKGYVHSLGHGLGLDVHESPRFRQEEGNEDILQPGSVITVEPGLYYPEQGLGVRLENTVWVRPDGKLETLGEYPMDLVLKVSG
jgi:Xaa-Pro aminopeptidase